MDITYYILYIAILYTYTIIFYLQNLLPATAITATAYLHMLAVRRKYTASTSTSILLVLAMESKAVRGPRTTSLQSH